MSTNIRLVQLQHAAKGRQVAIVEEPNLIILKNVDSVYNLALQAIDSGKKLSSLINESISDEKLKYDDVYNGTSEWKLLPSFDNPAIPSHCIVSGTGLTHNSSALNRQVMHQTEAGTLTDSMKVYQWGVEGGKPGAGKIGIQPEWFYKGTGSVLRGHGDALLVPDFGNDGGEEPEIAGIYIIDRKGQPVRIGFTTGNEFSDHIMEKKNYLYLAPSKLRTCSIGPEIVITNDFSSLEGHVSVTRNGKELWSANIQTGENNMAHSLENLEYHHFKYTDHRQPLQAHVHFFGTGAFSFGTGLRLETGDVMKVEWKGMGRALLNTISIDTNEEKMIHVKEL